MKEFTKEEIKEICKNKDLSKSSITECLFRHNADLTEYCLSLIERHKEVFEKKSEVLQFICNDYEFKYCETCGKHLKFKRFKNGTKFCSCRCSTKNAETQKKLKMTNLKKYGVEHFSELESERKKISIKNRLNKDERNRKREETCLKKYGVKTSLLNSDIKEKTKATLINLYGAENISQSKYGKDKKRETCLKHFGVDSYSKTNEYKNVFKNSNYFSKSIKEKMWKHMNELTDFEPNFKFSYDIKNEETYSWKCKHCGKIIYAIYNNGNVLKTCECQRKFYGSNLEDNIFNKIKEKYPNSIHHAYNLIKPYEIDIFIPELNVGIEIDGIFWHNINRKPINYHYNKSNLAFEKGIKLIHIYEDELNDDQNIVFKILENYELNFTNLITENILIIDYSKYFKIKIDGYSLIKEIEPKFEMHDKNLIIENCGYGVYLNNAIKNEMKQNKKMVKEYDDQIKELEKQLKEFN